MADETPETGPARIPDRTERNAATSFRDHGGGPPSEAPNFTDRPNDLKISDHEWALPNSTLASRAKARKAVEKKQQAAADTENKAVSSSRTTTKRRAKKA